MAKQDKKQKEIEENLVFFSEKLPDLLHDHRGRYVLLRHREIIGIYDTVADAKTTGDKFYKDGIFSIQKVTDEPIELGAMAHALHLG